MLNEKGMVLQTRTYLRGQGASKSHTFFSFNSTVILVFRRAQDSLICISYYLTVGIGYSLFFSQASVSLYQFDFHFIIVKIRNFSFSHLLVFIFNNHLIGQDANS